MRHESKFSVWIRSGGNSVFVLPLSPVRAPEVKFSVVPDRLLDSIIDDALAAGVTRLNGFLPESVSIDITSVDLAGIRDQLRTAVAERLGETGVPVNPNEPAISAILARYAEALNGHFQRDALQLDTYIWRSQDDIGPTAWDRSSATSGATRTKPCSTGELPTIPQIRKPSQTVPTGINRAAADSITAIINRGTDSYGQRWENVRRLSESEVFANVCRFSVSRPRFEDAE